MCWSEVSRLGNDDLVRCARRCSPRGRRLQRHQTGQARNNESIEIFHNRRRRHSSLGMLAPIEFELKKINTTRVAA